MIIKYFMWGFQHYYQNYIEDFAKNLFKKISNDLTPKVIILGVQKKDIPGDPICLEPEKCGVSVKVFEIVSELAEDIHRKDSRHQVSHTDQNLHEIYHEDLKIECLVKAVTILANDGFKDLELINFVSKPVTVNNYDVFIVLQFKKSNQEKIFTLSRNEFEINPIRPQKVYRSLIEAVIDVFLEAAIQPLYKPNQDRQYYDLDTNYEEILKKGGKKYLESVVAAGTNSRMGSELFEVCNLISSLKYEGISNYGRLIIAEKNHPDLEIIIELGNKISLRDIRFIRKLLVMSSDKLRLYTNGIEVIGFVKPKNTYDPSKENLFEIVFMGDQKWEFRHANTTYMKVQYSNPSIPFPEFDYSKLESTLRRVFDIDDQTINEHVIIIKTLVKQNNGTIIIISKEAEREANRLKNQSISIKKNKPDKNTLELISSIDGALLFDNKTYCLSIGVILDGKVSKNEVLSRGSRYNSSIRYIDSNKGKSIAIIISKDGIIDLYPDLMPQINKNEFSSRMKNLLDESNKEKPDYDKYQPIFVWFDKHRFYLDKEICISLNNLKKSLKENLIVEFFKIYFEINDFSPDPEMNDSYFTDN